MTTTRDVSSRRFPEHSPTVAGRWLAMDIRRLRLAAGLKQSEVGKELGCAHARIGHIETGHSPIRRADLYAMLPLYGVPEERRAWYFDLCDKARQKGWWDGADGVPSWFSLYLGLEWGAEAMRWFEMGFVPGLLQTDAYMRGLITRQTDAPADADEIVERRLQRQQVMTRELDPLSLHVVIDEAALVRAVGDRRLMRDQWSHLAEVADQPGVTLQVMPFDSGPQHAHLGSFQILDFPSTDDPGVVYLETLRGGLYLEENDELEDFRTAFDRLTGLALAPEDSIGFLKKLARSRQ